MGIGSWFGFGSRPERAPAIASAASRVPTSQDLLDAIDRVERQAAEGKAPGMVRSRLGRVARILRIGTTPLPPVPPSDPDAPTPLTPPTGRQG